jgi:nicotinamidase-related amidase
MVASVVCILILHIILSTTSLSIPKLDPKETALVLIEYQNEFLSEGGKLYDPLRECLEHTNMIENSAKLTKVAREKGVSIMHVPIMFKEVS